MEGITRETASHRATLSRISNKKGYVTTTEIVDRLCTYFGVPTNKVAEHLPDDANENQRAKSDGTTVNGQHLQCSASDELSCAHCLARITPNQPQVEYVSSKLQLRGSLW